MRKQDEGVEVLELLGPDRIGRFQEAISTPGAVLSGVKSKSG